MRHGAAERQAPNALGRPVGADHVAGQAPHLFGVGLEEGLVEALPEAVHDPVLERLLGIGRLEPCAQVARRHARAFHQAEVAHDVGQLERVGVVAALVEDARQPRHADHLAPEQLVPQPLDLGDLRVEAMAADVEAIAAIRLGARDAAHRRLGFVDRDGHARAREFQGGCEACGACTGDEHRVDVHQACSCRRAARCRLQPPFRSTHAKAPPEYR